jgi:putative transposase
LPLTEGANAPSKKGIGMKAGQMSDEQIVAVLREAEKGEKKIADLCREKGISENTFYNWRKKFGAMQTSDVKRLRELERENARLKRLLAEQALDNDILKEALSKNF